MPEANPIKPFERVMVFIDGGYLRRTFRNLFKSEKIDFEKLRHSLLQMYNEWTEENPFQADLIRVYYYDGIVDETEDEFEEQRNYFNLIRNEYFYTVRLGEAIKSSKRKLRQKGVDILMAIDALTKAYQNHYDTGMFFLGDRDFIPLVEAVKNAGKKTIGVFYDENIPDELVRVFDFRLGCEKEDLKPWLSKKRSSHT